MNQEIVTSTEQALALTKAEIDIQISTAKQFPRDLQKFKSNCISMVKSSKEIAQSCNYCLSRAGKSIKGPSVRLAEIIQNNWGNLRTAAKVLDENKEFIVVQGGCHDLENNVAVQVEVKRRITNKHGKRYGADMIQTTTAAAISIAMRNAIFKVVPNVYVMTLAKEAEKFALGSPDNFQNMVKQWFEWFNNAGISEDAILLKLGIEKKSQISKAHLITLQGIATALNDNMTTLENEFPQKMKEPQAADLNQNENPNGESVEGVDEDLSYL
jgi:hypothetical protein